MNPKVWGPAFWQTLFACTWNCGRAKFEILSSFLFQQTPLLLPCEKCRKHFLENKAEVDRKSGGVPKTPEQAFRWLWHLKDRVNYISHAVSISSYVYRGRPGPRTHTSPRHPMTISLDDLTLRYAFHGAVVDEVLLGDLLVIVVLEARGLERDAVFMEFCNSLVALLPLPEDSHLLRALRVCAERRPIVRNALLAARAARIERGLRVYGLAHYRSFYGE